MMKITNEWTLGTGDAPAFLPRKAAAFFRIPEDNGRVEQIRDGREIFYRVICGIPEFEAFYGKRAEFIKYCVNKIDDYNDKVVLSEYDELNTLEYDLQKAVKRLILAVEYNDRVAVFDAADDICRWLDAHNLIGWNGEYYELPEVYLEIHPLVEPDKNGELNRVAYKIQLGRKIYFAGTSVGALYIPAPRANWEKLWEKGGQNG